MMIWDERARGVLDRSINTRVKLSVEHAIEAALSRIDALETAIRKHRDQKGDDRCWMDDYALYAILDPNKPPYDSRLPPECEFLESCKRFWRQRQCPSDKVPLDPSAMTIAQLEAKIAEQATESNVLAAVAYRAFIVFFEAMKTEVKRAELTISGAINQKE